MTYADYLKKRLNYAMSEAPVEVREQAIKDLDAKWIAQNQSMVVEGDLSDFTE